MSGQYTNESAENQPIPRVAPGGRAQYADRLRPFRGHGDSDGSGSLACADPIWSRCEAADLTLQLPDALAPTYFRA